MINGLPDTALIFEPRESEVVRQRPDGRRLYLLNRPMLARIGFLGSWIGLCSLAAYIWALQSGSHAYAQTIVLTLLVLFQLFNSLNSQSATRSVWETWRGNKFLLVSVGLGLLSHLAILYTGAGQQVFRVVPLSLADWLVVVSAAMSLLALEEGRKYVVRNREAVPASLDTSLRVSTS